MKQLHMPLDGEQITGSANSHPKYLHSGFISTQRLVKALQQLGEIQPNEKVLCITAQEDGLAIHFKDEE